MKLDAGGSGVLGIDRGSKRVCEVLLNAIQKSLDFFLPFQERDLSLYEMLSNN